MPGLAVPRTLADDRTLRPFFVQPQLFAGLLLDVQSKMSDHPCHIRMVVSAKRLQGGRLFVHPPANPVKIAGPHLLEAFSAASSSPSPMR